MNNILRMFFRAMAVTAIVLILAGSAAAQESDEDSIVRGLDKMARILELIQREYMEDIDLALVIESGITGMLDQLDPHSTYFNPEQTRRMLTEQEGEYYGVGLTIGVRNDELTVISPMEDGPAARQGIRTGDVITHIDGEPTAGQNLEIVARNLRGPAGTTVTVTIVREGLSRPFEVTITREKISLHTVQFASMVQESVGYIRLLRFARTSGDEVAAAIASLKAQGMKGLILDLRSNPGGDLSQAVAVANLFLDDGLIVYTQGLAPASRIDYNADSQVTKWQGPLVVLINRGSASGSEVVAGALQDQDRAILAGETSWGKGLVQTVLPLSHGAALALTTARYYTPSGRLIQRRYDPGQFDQYYNPDAEDMAELVQPATTSLGRIVYGGNGLQPDEIVEEAELTPLAQEVFLQGLIFDFVTNYLGMNPEAGEDFVTTEAIMQEFHNFISEYGVEIKREQWEQDKSFLAARIQYELVSRVAGSEAGFRSVMPHDRQLQRAIELLPQAEELLQRKMAQKGH